MTTRVRSPVPQLDCTILEFGNFDGTVNHRSESVTMQLVGGGQTPTEGLECG